VPGWTWERSVKGLWDPEALSWGPAYEPHRHPQGAPLGSRLPLPPGRYHLLLSGEALGGAPPDLVLLGRGEEIVLPFKPGEGGWEADFEVQGGETTLLLRGGGALLLRSILLQAQPLETLPV
jgi:hypothetical protein